jgi:membrane associated rhomboid family serine protease
MAVEKSNFWKNTLLVFALLSILWIVQLIQYFGIADLSTYGNWPHHLIGLKGIIFSPFIHGSFDHLISNTLPMLVLLTVLLNAYPRTALLVLVFVHLLSGTLVWSFAPDTGVHIGISGIIYGIASFLVASGIFRKDRTSVSIAILVGLVYGSMVWGFIPQEGISWQSHLYGAISGVIIAFIVRKRDLPPATPTELEQSEEDRHFFEQVKPNHQNQPGADI